MVTILLSTEMPIANESKSFNMYDTNEDTSLSMPQDDHSSDKIGPLGPRTQKLTGKERIFQGYNSNIYQH